MRVVQQSEGPRTEDILRRLFRAGGRWSIWGGLCGFCVLATPGQAGSVGLAWSASPDPEVNGYEIFYGEASGLYTGSVNAGTNLTATVTGLTPGLTYYFVATSYHADGEESVFSNEVTNRLPIPASIVIEPLPQTVLAGTPVTLSVVAVGDPPLRFQWLEGLAPIPGATNSFLNWPQFGSGNAGAYTVVVSNPWGSATSSVATLSVSAASLPLILIQPQSQTVVVSNAVVLSPLVIGSGPLSFQWYVGKMAIAGATNSILAWAQIGDSNAGAYSFSVSNPAGVVNSSIAYLTVVDPPSILAQPQSQTAVVSSPVSFAPIVAGSGPLSIQWYVGKTPIPGATNSTLSWAQVADGNAGAYSFSVSNFAGVVNSSLARLAVIDPPAILVQPQAQTVVVSNPASFSPIVAGTGPLSIQWYDGKTAIAGATNSILSWAQVADSNAGAYSFSISNSAGVLDSVLARLIVIDPPSILTQPQSQTVTVGNPASFSSVVSGSAPLAIQWYDGGVAVAGATSNMLAWANVAGSNTGNYYFTLSNAGGAVTSAVATLTVLPTNLIATVAGTYNGLFFQTNGDGTPDITEMTAGMLANCVVAGNGAYSAKLYLGGASYTLSGVFSSVGSACATIPLTNASSSNITVMLSLDLFNGTQQMTGSVSSAIAGEAWRAPLIADLATNTLPWPETFEMVLPAGLSGSGSGNFGAASGVVVNSVLTLTGVLADGTAISQTVPVSQEGNVPLHFNLYEGAGLLEGWISLAGGNVTGSLTWICPVISATSEGGFIAVSQVSGATTQQ